MYREKINDLIQWKQSPIRKPLILRGARQTGKTWLLQEFGQTEYKKTVYVNFEQATELQNMFLPDLNINRLLTVLELYSHLKITPENTLIIFDEIQSAEKGLTALKYFCEDAPQYHVIAAGSLLGMSLHKNVSFPVGKVDFMNLYPLSFMEFLLAIGEQGFVQALNNQDWSVISVFSQRLNEYLRYYLYVGGMPEAVFQFSQDRDWTKVRQIQNRIINAYENDFSKHAPNEIVPRINMVWRSMPAQLSKENKKFIYGVIKEGARAKDFELAIQWLIDSGLLSKCYRISKPHLPLIAYQDLSAFKLFFNDVGLLGAMAGLDTITVIDSDALFTEFKGALTEQYVFQQLILDRDIFVAYWTNDRGSSEVDFVVQKGNKIIPIEVKSGENLKAKSFKLFCEKYHPTQAIRTSLSDYRKEDWMTNLPLYAIEGVKN
jgi:predicted AAA+ superfamily ATPase